MKKSVIAVMVLMTMIGGAVYAQRMPDYSMGNSLMENMKLQEGEVRALVVGDATQLIGGPKAEGRIGDFLIYNGQVGFVIAGARPASGINPMGGVVEDAGLIVEKDGSLYWRNLMGDPSFVVYKGKDPLTGSRLLAPVKVEILKDGAEGEAVVRVYARDAEFPMRKEYMGYASKAMKVKLMVDYILRPDSNVLEIKLTAINEKKGKLTLGVGQTYLMGDGASPYVSGCGFENSCITEARADVFMAAGEGIAYGWFLPENTINLFMQIDNLLIADSGTVSAPGGGEGSVTAFLAVGEDPADIYSEFLAVRGVGETGTIEGSCLDSASGAPITGAQIHIVDKKSMKPVVYANVRSNGRFHANVPAGEYVLLAISENRTDAEPVAVSVTPGKSADASIKIGPPAVVEYEVKDDAGAFIPATLSFMAVDENENLISNPEYFEDRMGGGFSKNHFTGTGTGNVEVRPGKYELYISRGLEYEYVKVDVDLVSGETSTVSAELVRSVDTSGYLSGDFHVHAAPSQDSDDKLYEKILGIAAVGLEVAIATDHDMRTNYVPVINELGMEKNENTMIGNELTTNRLGHFNAFPLTYDVTLPNNGATSWFGLTTQEIFKAFRDDPEEKTVVQINHARDISLGHFNFINYNPEKGAATDLKNFSLNFDAMEILNGGSYDRAEKLLVDWFSFLNRGKAVTGTGNSDSHKVFKLEVGYPRNYVWANTDVPGEMDRDVFLDSIHSQQVSVSGGAFILVSLNDNGVMGDIVTSTDGEANINIKIQAPSWVDVDTLTILGNGSEISKISLEPSNTAVVYDDTIHLKADEDTWYVVVAQGEKDLFPVYPGKRVFSFSNPVYLDVDGNGQYDPPLSF